MNASPSPDDFSALRRVLALKRHEVPPPGYFDDFSTQVMARIRAEEASRSRSGIGNLWNRWFSAFSAERIFSSANLLTGAGAAFVAVSLTLILSSDPAGPDSVHLGNGVVVSVQPLSVPQSAGLAGGGLPSSLRYYPSPVLVSLTYEPGTSAAVAGRTIPATVAADSESLGSSPDDSTIPASEIPPAGMFETPSARGFRIQPVSVPVYQPMDR